MTEKIQVFRFTKDFRYAVVKKQPRWLRHRCDFKHLHVTRENAEAEVTSSLDAEREEFDDKTSVEQASAVKAPR
jgi:hypothetical protein